MSSSFINTLLTHYIRHRPSISEALQETVAWAYNGSEVHAFVSFLQVTLWGVSLSWGYIVLHDCSWKHLLWLSTANTMVFKKTCNCIPQRTFSNVWRHFLATGVWWGEARDAAKNILYCLVHLPTIKNYLAQNVSSAHLEKLSSKWSSGMSCLSVPRIKYW